MFAVPEKKQTKTKKRKTKQKTRNMLITQFCLNADDIQCVIQAPPALLYVYTCEKV